MRMRIVLALLACLLACPAAASEPLDALKAQAKSLQEQLNAVNAAIEVQEKKEASSPARYLAELDETPADDAWLFAVGGKLEARRKEDEKPVIMFKHGNYYRFDVFITEDDDRLLCKGDAVLVYRRPTRGQVRTLARLLQMTLHEAPNPIDGDAR